MFDTVGRADALPSFSFSFIRDGGTLRLETKPVPLPNREPHTSSVYKG